MSDIRSRLLGLHSDAAGAISQAVDKFGPEFGQLLQLDADVRVWAGRLGDRPEVMQLAAARRELGFAIYAASSALYVHAYAGLRLFIELSFASVHFSANELHRRKWIADRQDFSWGIAVDEENGVLSANFVREFNPRAINDAGKQAKNVARVYRHCSQFVHGKLAVTQRLPDRLQYSEIVVGEWLRLAIDAAKAVIYLLYVRYGEELICIDNQGNLEETVLHSFGHLTEVRARLGLPVEED